jgi:predicted protein tyrosine phosphatase
MCTVLLPPGGNPNAFNKYIITHSLITLEDEGITSEATRLVTLPNIAQDLHRSILFSSCIEF